MRLRFSAIVLMILALPAWGCTKSERPRSVLPVVVPASPSSVDPFLTEGADGAVYLSWVEETEDGHRLEVSRWESDGWSEPVEIARGSDWFVNWADVPGLTALEDGTLVAAWLARLEGGPYAYGVQVAVSTNRGASWSEPVTPHRDGTATEHGFVSLLPLPGGSAGIVWLDGRDTAEPPGGGNPGPMTLRFTTIDRSGRPGEEVLLDDRVCDCCPTDMARLPDGTLLVVYRDRSDGEVRDTGIVRREGQTWSAPALVHADGWRIEGCPVNGPRIATDGNRVAVTWFTAPAEDNGEVRLAFSEDGGRTFEAPIRVDEGNPLGRQDVVLLPDHSAVVTWLEEGAEGTAAVMLREIDPSGTTHPAVTAATTTAARASGCPRLARTPPDILLAWTEPGDPPHIRTAIWK